MPKTLLCSPILLSADLSGKVIIVTGANSGVGLETARQLISQKATVVLACRNPELGQKAAKDTGGTFIECDLSDLQSVRKFVKEFMSKFQRLDVLVNNAGIMACPLARTNAGWESQFATNHLGHFLLTCLLMDVLEKSAPSRVICVSSVASAQAAMGVQPEMAKIDFDDLMFERRKYHPMTAYGQSKLANVLHASEIARRSKCVQAVSLHPGWVNTKLDKHVVGQGCFKGCLASCMMKKGDMLAPADGAQTTLHCVLSPEIENGAFYSQFGVYKDKACTNGGWPMKLPNPNNTPENAKRLWDASASLVAIE